MKVHIVVIGGALAILAGCGANKNYVDQQVAAAEARSNAKTGEVAARTETLASEVARMNQLALDLQKKTDLAINKVSGFENYQVLWSGELTFAFESFALSEASRGVLAEAAGVLNQYGGSLIEIVGHTDQTGSDRYNLMLGQERADAAKQFLADQHNIMLYRMFTLSYGKAKPAVASDSRMSGSKNRRVTLRVWGPPIAQQTMR